MVANLQFKREMLEHDIFKVFPIIEELYKRIYKQAQLMLPNTIVPKRLFPVRKTKTTERVFAQ